MRKLIFVALFLGVALQAALAQPTRVIRQPPSTRPQQEKPKTPATENNETVQAENEIVNSDEGEKIAARIFPDIDLVKLPNSSAKGNFLLGEDTQSFTEKRTVRQFSINKYETTYRLWHEVRVEAEKLGYSFRNPGQEGSLGRRGRPPKQDAGTEPVTMINWYDAVVWCNALSELSGKTPCYTFRGQVLRNSAESAKLDLCVCDWNVDGYRLPTETEWEFAARALSEVANVFQRGDLASGQKDEADATPVTENDVSWNETNTNGTRPVGTAGSIFEEDSQSGSGVANGAGLFDMSGNVIEFCWDWLAPYEPQKSEISAGPKIGSERVLRGGSWSKYAPYMTAGERYSFDPNEAYNYLGFRIVTSK